MAVTPSIYMLPGMLPNGCTPEHEYSYVVFCTSEYFVLFKELKGAPYPGFLLTGEGCTNPVREKSGNLTIARKGNYEKKKTMQVSG